MTNDMTNDLLYQHIEEEAASSEGLKTSFGQLTVETKRYLRWNRDNEGKTFGQPDEIPVEVFSTLPTRDRSIEVNFNINIQEFNPGLDFSYDRKMLIGGPDFQQIVIPSLAEIMQIPIKKGNYGTVIQQINGKYVEANDVPQVKGDEYNTISFARIFNSMEECQQAYVARFGSPVVATATPAEATGPHPATTAPVAPAPPPPAIVIPNGYTEESWAETVPFIKEEITKGTPNQQIAEAFTISIADVMGVKNAM